MSLVMHAATNRFRSLPLISVAAIEGAAVGGGAELTTCCDHRILSHDAYIHFVHAKMVCDTVFFPTNCIIFFLTDSFELFVLL